MLDEQGRPKLDTALYAEMYKGERTVGRRLRRDVGRGARTAGASGRSFAKAGRRARDTAARHPRPSISPPIPRLALDLAIFLMIDRDVGYSSEKSGSSLVAYATVRPRVRVQDSGRGGDGRLGGGGRERSTAAGPRAKSRRSGSTPSARFPKRARGSLARPRGRANAGGQPQSAGQRSCAFHDHLGQLARHRRRALVAAHRRQLFRPGAEERDARRARRSRRIRRSRAATPRPRKPSSPSPASGSSRATSSPRWRSRRPLWPGCRKRCGSLSSALATIRGGGGRAGSENGRWGSWRTPRGNGDAPRQSWRKRPDVSGPFLPGGPPQGRPLRPFRTTGRGPRHGGGGDRN